MIETLCTIPPIVSFVEDGRVTWEMGAHKKVIAVDDLSIESPYHGVQQITFFMGVFSRGGGITVRFFADEGEALAWMVEPWR